MSPLSDHYATLGLKPTATAEQIKHAYREAAKRAHPDAGGSLEAMQRLNAAYQVLSDPAARRTYDHSLGQPASGSPSTPPAAHTHHPASRASHYAGHEAARRAAEYAAAEASAARHEAELHHRRRLSQARSSAWRILRDSAVMAVLLETAIHFFAAGITDPPTRLFLKFIGFVPVYGVLLGIIFLLSPTIRLDLHDFIYHLSHPKSPNPHFTKSELATLAGLVLAFMPLALLWLGLHQ